MDKAIYFKNRAAVILKQSKYVTQECDKALNISPNNPKGLFRLCLALKAVQMFEEAYRDARHVISVDPSNKLIQPIASCLEMKFVKEDWKKIQELVQS